MMDRIKSRRFCFGLGALIVFAATIYLFTIDKSAAITILGAGLASLAGAYAAFDFDKNERMRMNKRADRKSSLLLIESFKSEYKILKFIVDRIEDILNDKQLRHLPYYKTRIQIIADNSSFLLNYDNQLFTQINTTTVFLEIYCFDVNMKNESMKSYSSEKQSQDITKNLEGILRGGQISLELALEAIQDLTEFGEKTFKLDLSDTFAPAPQPTPEEPPA